MRSFISLLFVVMCCMNGMAQTYIEPVFDRTDVPSLHINKIEVTKDTTFVHCTYTAEADSWARISKDTYLYDHDKHKKYRILRCSGLPFSPHQRDFHFGGTEQITFYFPSIGNSTKFDFIEEPNEEAFNIYGINLKEQFETVYKETDYEHFSRMSSLFDITGNDSVVIQYKKREVEAAQYIHGVLSMEYFNSLLGACFMYDKYGFYNEATSQMNHLKDIHTEVWGEEDKYNYAMFVRTLAQFYSHASNHTMSIKTYKESLNLFESIHAIDNEYALALRFIADEYNDIGDNESSLYYQQKALEARRTIGDSDKYINELYNVALLSPIIKGFVEPRIHIVEKELESLPDFVDNMSVAFVEIYEKLAFSFTLLEDNNTAIKYCDKALMLLKERGEDETEKYAEVLGEKCRYQKQVFLYNDAITTGEKGMRLFETLHIKSTKCADLVCDLAGIYSNIEDYEKATQMLEVACSIYEETSDWLSLAEGLSAIGNCYQLKYDFEKAEKYIQKGLYILSQNIEDEQYVTYAMNEQQRQAALVVEQDRIQRIKSGCHSELANIYSEKGEKEKAIEEEKEAVRILQEMANDKVLYHLHLSRLASYYRENGQFDEAINCEKQNLVFWENTGENFSVICALGHLAITYFTKGDTIKAIEYAKRSVLTSRANGNNILERTLGLLSAFYWKSSMYEEAEKCISEALDSIQTMISSRMMEMTSEQKQRMWNKYRNYFFIYRDIIYKSEKDEVKLSKLYNYVLFSKSLLLDSGSFNDDELSARLNITWKDIQKQLSSNDIAIEFIATQEEMTEQMTYYAYHALVIDKDSDCPKMVTLIHDKGVENDTEHVSQLWNPILDQYKDVKNIYFSPDGVMHGLPIENLYVNNIGFLSDQYNMYRLSSTKELVKPHKELKIEDAVLYGGLSYSIGDVTDLAMAEGERANLLRGIKERGGFDPLYSTSTEIYNISELLEQNNIRTTLYMSENGTEDSFKELSGTSIDLIHLATHGMFVENENVVQRKEDNNFVFMESMDNEKSPVYENTLLTHSFLVMAGGNKVVQRETTTDKSNDGILTAQEISRLDLSGIDLVVLSACETAKGDLTMDGILGLPWGFKKAGVNTILMSLNEVDDEATTLLMIEFYKNLMSGKSKLQSLKDAQKYLREYDNGKYIDPKYWQSFIMLDGLD